MKRSSTVYCAFFSDSVFFSDAAFAAACSIRLCSLLSRPRVIIGFGSSSANKYLQMISNNQHPAKSITIVAVSLNLNYT